MKTFDGTPFVTALRSLLGTLLAGHPDSQALLDDVTAGRVTLRILIDQAGDVLTLTTQQDGERRLVAIVHMAAASSSWPVVYLDGIAEPTPSAV